MTLHKIHDMYILTDQRHWPVLVLRPDADGQWRIVAARNPQLIGQQFSTVAALVAATV